MYVSKRSTGGLPPSTDRTTFLAELARSCAKSAECLLIYGSSDPSAWQEQTYSNTWHGANREITKAFLVVDKLDAPTLVEGRPHGTKPQPIALWEANHRRAVWCRALSGQNVTDAYVAVVRELINVR